MVDCLVNQFEAAQLISINPATLNNQENSFISVNIFL
jgi:hypothetical protein